MKKTLIITEKNLYAKQLAKVGVFGAPTSFKIYDGVYFENDKYIIIPCQGHLFVRMLPHEIDASHSFAYKKVEGYDYSQRELLSKAKLKPDKKAMKIINAMKKILARDDLEEICYSGDADAEGEAIVRHAVNLLSKNLDPSIKHTRLYNSGSFDLKPVIEKAFNGRLPLKTPIYENLYASREARSDVDYYSGMVFCRLYTDKTGQKFVYGRVKISLLSMICNRELAIANFKPRDYANIKAFIGKNIKDKDGIKFSAFREEEKIDETGVKKKEHSGQFFYNDPNSIAPEKIIADVKAANYKGKVVENRSYETSSRKPTLYNLNDFNSDFMTLYNVSAEYSEACLEFLRFKGYTSYSRTDGNYYPTSEIGTDKTSPDGATGVNKLHEDVLTHYKKEIAELKANNQHYDILPVTTDLPLFDDAKAKKQNHTPIVVLKHLTPEDIKFLSQTHTPAEGNSKMQLKHLREAFELVATRCAVQFLPDDKVLKQEVIIEIGGHLFETSTAKTLYKGWKEFDKNANISNGKELNISLSVGDDITVDGIDLEKHVTKPPKRYTEDTLRKACVNVKQALLEEINNIEDEVERKKRMERYTKNVKLFENAKGIGTQGTLKDIFIELKKDGVFDIVKNELLPTEKGLFVYKTIHPYLRTLEFTAILESNLIDIRSGDKTLAQFKKEFIEDILGKIALSEAERDIQVAIRTPPPKMLAYAEAMAKKLGIELPSDYQTNYAALSDFLEKNKAAYDKCFSQLPDYIKNSFEQNKDKIDNDIYQLVNKTSISKEEYIKAMEVYKTLPKTYSSFLDSIINAVLKNEDKLDAKVVEIVKVNKPTPDEYQMVMTALNGLKRTFSEKQMAVIEKNMDKLSKKAQSILKDKKEFSKEEYDLIKKDLDKLFKK